MCAQPSSKLLFPDPQLARPATDARSRAATPGPPQSPHLQWRFTRRGRRSCRSSSAITYSTSSFYRRSPRRLPTGRRAPSAAVAPRCTRSSSPGSSTPVISAWTRFLTRQSARSARGSRRGRRATACPSAWTTGATCVPSLPLVRFFMKLTILLDTGLLDSRLGLPHPQARPAPAWCDPARRVRDQPARARPPAARGRPRVVAPPALVDAQPAH